MDNAEFETAKKESESWYWWGVPTFFRCPWKVVGNTSKSLGYQMLTMEKIETLGIEKTIEIIRERVGDTPVYITFDLDCLDSAIAPGVSNLEPGFEGMSIRQATKILQGLKGLNVIGGDVACLMPTKDNPNKITSQVAMVMMFELLSLVSLSIRDVETIT
jgi:guanidinopropionase